MDKQTKEENKLVSEWLIDYPRRKAVYESLRDAFAYPGRTADPDGGTNRYGKRNLATTDHTARIGILLAEGKIVPEDELDPDEVRWLELIEDVERGLPWKLQVILRLRRDVAHKQGLIRRGRLKGRPAWIPYVQHRYADEVARRTGTQLEDVWIESPQVFSGWWAKIVDFAARVAAKRGLL